MEEGSLTEAADEIWQLFKETDAKFKETRAQFRETDARLDRRFQETDEKLRRLEGMFGIQWGRMIEALVKPAALSLFRGYGIDVHHTYQRLESRINGQTMELDVVLENDRESVVIEVKSLVKVEDIDDFLEDLGQILSFFTRYDHRRVFGAIAGLEFAEGADRYAYRKGLFVLALTGEGMVRIKNDAAFQPFDFGTVSA